MSPPSWGLPLLVYRNVQNYGDLRGLRADVVHNLHVTLAGMPAPADINLAQVAGTATVEAGVAGVQAIGGTQAAETAVKDASFPIQTAGLVRDVLIAIADGQTSNLLQDTSGRLYTRDAAYSAVLGALQAAVNTIADDRTDDPVEWADETNVAAATNYPSSAGQEVGNRTNIAIDVQIRDGSFEVQALNTGGIWTNITKSGVDMAEGLNGYDGTHYAEPDAATVGFKIDFEKMRYQYIRIRFTPNNATNVFSAHVIMGAH